MWNLSNTHFQTNESFVTLAFVLRFVFSDRDLVWPGGQIFNDLAKTINYLIGIKILLEYVQKFAKY